MTASMGVNTKLEKIVAFIPTVLTPGAFFFAIRWSLMLAPSVRIDNRMTVRA